MALKKNKQKLIVLLGPTASGKTSLSIALAKALDTEIISGDSMLMYRGFDIGSAKPTLEEMDGVKHHLVDCLEPDASFNVMDFVSTASSIIDRLNAQGKIPIICGGTGLYIKSLLEGYQFNTTGEDKEYRSRLEAIANEKGNEYVHSMLAAVNPRAAAELHPNNLRRIIRALEVYHIGGEQISNRREAAVYEEGIKSENTSTEYIGAAPVEAASSLVYDAYVIGLQWDRAKLYQRINMRVDIMMEQGLLQEVAGLLAAGVSPECQAMQSIGYKDIAGYLQKYSLDDKSEEARQALAIAVDEIKKKTRHFAKRQLTWYRKMPYIKWYEPAQYSKEINNGNISKKVIEDVDIFVKKG